ncbi:unnamed protein product [Owenia fusiformis]|uniref:Glycosyltransferase 61 catalytic domain-containing protein n=1 Tax=Owenia fusiformis TaxID=6347 RepID=A0A8J1UJ84_OWEFU|nr:unnamed protein product [Owenia fusiformis]
MKDIPCMNYMTVMIMNYFRVIVCILCSVAVAVVVMNVVTVYETVSSYRNRPIHDILNKGDKLTHSYLTTIEDDIDVIYEHLEKHRTDAIRNQGLYQRVKIPKSHMANFKDISSSRDDYFLHISTEPNIKTLLFEHLDPDTGVEPTQGFQWIGSKSLCKVLNNYTGGHGYTGPCIEDMEQAFSQTDAELTRTRYKMPLNEKLTGEVYQWSSISSFIHIMQNAVVLPNGVVYIGSLQVVPKCCLGPSVIKESKQYFDHQTKYNLDSLIVYPEVFVISQKWSEGFYHGIVESITRLSRYIQFIQKHSQIKLYMACSHFMLIAVQTLFPSRNISEFIICDNTSISASLVYFPEGSSCGRSTPEALSLSSTEFRNKINIVGQPKNYILLIQRTKDRFLVQHREIAVYLNEVAKDSGMELFVFTDDPLPAFKDAMQLFNQAKLVVAPHGAGLSNTLFSNPGLFIIEVVCKDPNLCYRRLAINIGHHYHGVSSKFGCPTMLNVDVKEVKDAVRFYINKITD